MDGMCMSHFVTEELRRSFEGILGKNGHTFLPYETWKKEAAQILRDAWNHCDFSTPCYFCAFYKKADCQTYREGVLNGFVRAFLEEKIAEKRIALCYYDRVKSKLHFFKTLKRAGESKEEVWIADYDAICAEASIAHQIEDRVRTREISEERLSSVLKWSQIGEKFKISNEQQEVVRKVLSQNMVVVDGGPGTGKTTILRIIYQYYFDAFPDEVFCCAPTGKAAKRLSEATHSSACTIHRLLGAAFDEEAEETFFFYTEKNHHPGKVFLVDEASMVDAMIFDAFLSSIDTDAVVILVGDSHQLPSVGAGRVLADLIGSSTVPVCTLVENFRQLHDSLIVQNASNILHGREMLFPDDQADCHLIPTSSKDMLAKVEEWVKKENPDLHVEEWKETAILCPKRNGSISTNAINERLQKMHAEKRGVILYSIEVGEGKKRLFAKEDRVIQVKNNYKLLCREGDGTEGSGVWNGDIGYVDRLAPSSQFPADVIFDDARRATYTAGNLQELELAYALTVHKAQGGEWKRVLLVLPPEFGPIFNRNLLYTAVTRAKEELWIIGEEKTISRMIRSQYSETRRTALKLFLDAKKNQAKEQDAKEKESKEKES